MFARGKRALFAAALSAVAIPMVAGADQATDQRVKELEAKVAALESRQASDSKDVATTIDSVLRDAEKRSQLLQMNANMGAGYDNGFFIQSGDAWTLRPGVMFQFQSITNYRESGSDDGDDDDDEMESGFEVHRLEFSLEGTAFTKDLQYAFLWDTGNSSGSFVLLDAFVRYMFADDWGFRAGQFNDPVHHENLLADGRLLAAERSLVDALIGGGLVDRTQGVALIYGGYSANNPLNLEIAFHDGFNQDNTDFTRSPSFLSAESNFGVGGRIEIKAAGDWNAYNDFQAMGNKEDLLVFGAGGDWTQFGDGNVYHGTADVQWETTGGLGLYGALLVQHAEEEFVGTDDATNWGGLVQAAYMLNPAWELFGRYSYTEFDEETTGTDDDESDLSEITVGINYYLGNNGSAGHRAKVTVDVTWLPDGVPFDLNFKGFQANADDEWVVRGQFQLWI